MCFCFAEAFKCQLNFDAALVTSYPAAAVRASCLAAAGGDGADGWEDERRDKKAFGKI